MNILSMRAFLVGQQAHVVINDPYSPVDAVGTITHIDDIGQVFGTWSGLAAIPGVDYIELLDSPYENTIISSLDKKAEYIVVETTDGRIFRIAEGTGDALSDEDRAEGLVDYISYDYYNCMACYLDDENADGGFFYFKKPFSELTVDEILDDLAAFEDVKFKRGN